MDVQTRSPSAAGVFPVHRTSSSQTHSNRAKKYTARSIPHTADNQPRAYAITRDHAATLAAASQQKFALAKGEGFSAAEITPVEMPASRKGRVPAVAEDDEGPIGGAPVGGPAVDEDDEGPIGGAPVGGPAVDEDDEGPIGGAPVGGPAVDEDDEGPIGGPPVGED